MRLGLIYQLFTLYWAAAAPSKHDRENARITNQNAFSNGAGNKNSGNVRDGVVGGVNQYIYYSGPASQFPDSSQWVSFESMFNNYKGWLSNFCRTHKWGPNNTERQNRLLYDAVQTIADASHVDHRFILAVIMQESGGCVWVPTTGNGVTNPGLMQSHGGVAFNPRDEKGSIFRMVKDGTQGTADGDGLTQAINSSGDIYSAARIYNSGSIAPNGDLSDGNGATACYVSDIANRLTGWIDADSTCPGSVGWTFPQ